VAFRFDSSAAQRRVRGDIFRLRQIVLNLVGNAIKFTDRGSVELRLGCSEVAQDRWVFQISVKDTGIGIAPEHVPLLFANFTQVDSSVTRKHAGTGLGLAISRRLAELMGGTLKAISEPGCGSEFVLALPLPCVQETGAGVVPVLPTQFLSARVRHILLAEDNAVNRRLAVRILEKLGCRVDVAIDGLQAVEMAKNFPYEAIFMDCRMPELDGYEATRSIRSREMRSARVPIVALTAHAIAGAREECLEAGMDDYIAKPVQPVDLERALLKWCP